MSPPLPGGPVDPVPIALKVARALDTVGIPYLIGDSLASTYYGEPRSTLGVDFAAHVDAAQCGPLAAALEPDFFVDVSHLREAVAHGTMFNVIHRSTIMKVDVHVRPRSGHHAEEIRRAQPIQLSAEGRARLATAEDTLLRKLWWVRLSDGASDRQWRDVLGMLKASGARLDFAYLGLWAPDLGVAELLSRAYAEAGMDPRG